MKFIESKENSLIKKFRSLSVKKYREQFSLFKIEGEKVDYINAKTRNLYNMIDVNVYQENIFHTKMMLKDFDLDNYLFGITEAELSERENQAN